MFKNLAKELREFILRGNVLDMAVGIIIGASFKSIVDSMVNDIIMPPIGMLLGKVDFSNLYFQLSPTDVTYTSLEAAKAAGATFVKTSTGFGTGGATAADIKLMRETVGAEMGVKASGGVRSFDDVKLMVENGATRIGASSGIQIMKDASNVGE